MSCRLLRHEKPEVRPLFRKLAEAANGLDTTDIDHQEAGGGSTGAQAAADHLVLRNRIRDLEASIPTQVEAARTAAFREGEASGFERAVAANRPYLDKLTASIAEISSARARIRRGAEQDLIELSLAIAKRILRRELSVDPDAIQGVVRAALEKVQAREITRVRVAPGQEDAVRRSLAAAQAGFVEIAAESSLQPGDVVVETSRGNLDASVDSQLAEIERGFADRLR